MEEKTLNVENLLEHGIIYAVEVKGGKALLVIHGEEVWIDIVDGGVDEGKYLVGDAKLGLTDGKDAVRADDLIPYTQTLPLVKIGELEDEYGLIWDVCENEQIGFKVNAISIDAVERLKNDKTLAEKVFGQK